MMDDDGIDNEPPPLDISVPPGVGGGAQRPTTGFEYDRRYDSGLGESTKVCPKLEPSIVYPRGLTGNDSVRTQDAQAMQWDSRYDGLAIGTSIGGEDQ